jgi:hypothetical protein
MKTIFSAKVYESLRWADSLSGRLVAWAPSKDGALRAIEEFGSECRWSFAVIEEIAAGAHQISTDATWFKYNDDSGEWEEIDKSQYTENESFLTCVNHCIG